MTASTKRTDCFKLVETNEPIAIDDRYENLRGESTLSFEELVGEISAVFAESCETETDQAIVHGLTLVTRFWSLDFGYVYQFVTPEGPLEITHSYPSFQAKDSAASDPSLTHAEHDLALNHLMESSEPDATIETSQSSNGPRSCLSIPLWCSGRIFGVIQLGRSCDYRVWPEDILPRLRLVGEIFASAIARTRIGASFHELENLNQAVLNSITSRVVVIDAAGRIIAVNNAWAEAIANRFDGAGKVGGNYYEMCEAAFGSRRENLWPLLHGIREVINGSVPLFEMEQKSSNGSGQTWLITAKPFERNGAGGAVIAHADITQCKLVDERLRDLSGRLITAQEEERSRIARDLHDDLNQRLALLSIDLERLRNKSEAKSIRGDVLELWSRTQEISADVQRLSYQLHPTKLDQLGLVPAVRSYCDEITKHHDLVVRFNYRNIPTRLPREVSLSVFRIVQEGLGNIVRHSDSETASIELLGDGDEIQLRISDAGIGFDLALAKAGRGLGLVSMEERLRQINGRISIQSQPGAGTTIKVVIQLNRPVEILSDSKNLTGLLETAL